MTYPDTAAERDRWILSRRGARNAVDAHRAYACFVEEERSESGEVVAVATIFLTNRECPWHCLMCDLWKNTLPETTPPGAILQQLDAALPRLLSHEPRPRQVKLYNSGSFFDVRAIPPAEHGALAERLSSFERVIVECHPALVGESTWRFRDQLAGRLEVAMGLETAHAEVLARLNKRMTLEQFAGVASRLREEEVALRAFVLVKPPFLDEAEARYWGERSVDFALGCHATVTSLIPTRLGNGALDALAEANAFSIPELSTLEAVAAYGIGLGRARVFADVWELATFSKCTECFEARHQRLQRMNLTQAVVPAVRCPRCSAEESGS